MEFIFLNFERLFYETYQFFVEGNLTSYTPPRALLIFWDWVMALSTVLTLVLLTGIVYVWIRLSQVRREEHESYYIKMAESVSEEVVEERRNERWEQVLQHVNSDNSNDWRLAIIEADTILDDIVTRAGYRGENLGERLRGIERSDFQTLDEAWEAHKIRNRIAHEGSNFALTKREALRIIDLYRQVFEEFYFI